MAKRTSIDVDKALSKAAKEFNEKSKKYWGREYKPALKFYKRLGIFKASNVSLNPANLDAYSYGWWKFVKVIGDKVVFNNYRYSSSTSQHQHKVSNLLRELGVKIDLRISAPRGLDNLASAIDYYSNKINSIDLELAKPRSRKAKNIERLEAIKELQEKIKSVEYLINCEIIDEKEAT